MIDADTKMIDLKDRGENPAEGDPGENRYLLEINEQDEYNDDNLAIITFVEPLRFHAELAQADEERFSESSRQDWNTWASLIGGAGFLNDEPTDKLVAELQKLIDQHAGPDVTVERADYVAGDYEPALGVEFVTHFLPGETFGSWMDRIGWPVIATVNNATDPGTFNFPYLFSAILYN
jgi:hypothetical protein